MNKILFYIMMLLEGKYEEMSESSLDYWNYWFYYYFYKIYYLMEWYMMKFYMLIYKNWYKLMCKLKKMISKLYFWNKGFPLWSLYKEDLYDHFINVNDKLYISMMLFLKFTIPVNLLWYYDLSYFDYKVMTYRAICTYVHNPCPMMMIIDLMIDLYLNIKMLDIMIIMWTMDEYAINSLMSFWISQLKDSKMIVHSQIEMTMILILFSLFKMLNMRKIPYLPNFNMMAAKIMDPKTGDSTWALGNQMWMKYKGILTMNTIKKVSVMNMLLGFLIKYKLSELMDFSMIELKKGSEKMNVMNIMYKIASKRSGCYPQMIKIIKIMNIEISNKMYKIKKFQMLKVIMSIKHSKMIMFLKFFLFSIKLMIIMIQMVKFVIQNEIKSLMNMNLILLMYLFCKFKFITSSLMNNIMFLFLFLMIIMMINMMNIFNIMI
uniref:NADH dehydrogenase subunit 4 n=1 Tax=Aleurodicus dispersus TaxID=267823 RepID=A0A0X7ZBA9_9HEMI|nr:NADH dehydrogenase subunit 4 [Aleurodicus dispersus]